MTMTISLLTDVLLSNFPFAKAIIQGSPDYPKIHGAVNFYQLSQGVVVAADINGLPMGDGKCGCRVFAFHIHEGESCTGTKNEPLANTGGHYDPEDCPHPCHAGDMPPLFGNSGRAWLAFLTDRIKVEEIVGKTVVIHSAPDDFTTQPSGNSGSKIACGAIERLA